HPDASPASIETMVNGIVYENVRSRMGRRDHATLSVLRYQRDGRLSFAGAHEDILVHRASTGDVEVVETPGTWIGAVKDIASATTETRIVLDPGDVVVLYTDGVTEARREGAQFGLDRLIDVVRASAASPVAAIRDAVTGAVAAWAPSPDDDVSVVVLR